MRLQCFLLAAAIATVSCAPVIEKRTKEAVIVGNHQNAPRIKKSWEVQPEQSLPSNSDSKGFIRALDAHDILEEEIEHTSSHPQTEPIAHYMDNENDVESGSEVVNQWPIHDSEEDDSETEVEELAPLNVETNDGHIEPESQDESKNVYEDDVVSEHDGPANDLQQLIQGVEMQKNNPSGEWTPSSSDIVEEVEGSGELTELNSQFQDPDFLAQLYGEAPGYFYDTYGSPYRRKRSTASNVDEREMKRSHRTKRDLGYPRYLASLYPYGNSLDPYDENYPDPALSRYPYLYEFDEEEEPEEDFEPLSYLTGKPDLSDEDDFDALNDYNSDLLYRFKPRFQPAKRQSLSLVPGFRRKRFEYPHVQEPYGHWGAFVEDEKRDSYLEEYEKLYRLARMLARRQTYDDYLPELDTLGYKKKK